MYNLKEFESFLRKALHVLGRASLVLAVLLLLPWVATAAPPAQSGPWWADYFSNLTLSGSPVLSRFDQGVNFDWGLGSPGSPVPIDGFSARWTREAWFDNGTYRFTARSDDGLRLWVGDELIIDAWYDQQATWMARDLYLNQGTYALRVEYYERSGSALVQLGWERLTGGRGWTGEYYANRDLQGEPALVRDDRAINFAWEGGSPGPAVPSDKFSVRWTRTLSFPAGTYRFHAAADDGIRLWVDDRLLVDAWYTQSLPNDHWADVVLDDLPHQVKVEYFESSGGAHAHVWWERLDGLAGWKGEYYDNPGMLWPPVMTRDDAEIDFDWGTAPPVPWMPDDNFSVVWSREMTFEPGFYRIAVRADDGVRVWLDDTRLMIDKWQEMDYELHYVEGTYLSGPHRFRVEYFEKNGHARIHFWVSPTPWKAEFFANTDLKGDPMFVQLHETFNFDWRPEMPAAKFSIRWTTVQSFEAGRYAFDVISDDGVRFYVDGEPVVDNWQSSAYSSESVVRYLAAGEHTLILEYAGRTGAALVRLDWQPVALTPEMVTENFYNWYISYSKRQGDPWVSKAYRSSEYLADSFVQRLDQLVEDETLASLAGEGYDPILCAQGFPDRIAVGEAIVSGQDAWVVIQTYWNGGITVGQTTVNLKALNEKWKIANVVCQLQVDAALAQWPLYRDEGYGFQVKYPQNWSLQEQEVSRAQADTSLQRLLGFGPRDWEGTVMPVSVEVSLGSLREFYSLYPAMAAGQPSGTIINGYTVVILEGSDGATLYDIAHPTETELRVVVRDNAGRLGRTTGLPPDELADVVNRMLSTFRFVEQ